MSDAGSDRALRAALRLAPARAFSERTIGIGCLLAASASWGFNWTAIKVVSAEAPPMAARGTAALAACVLLFALAAARREDVLPSPDGWPGLIWRSFTNVFAWMGFSALSVHWLRIPEAALLVYTMPIWAMALSFGLQGARPGRTAILALVLAMTGVSILLGGAGSALRPENLPGVAFALAAAGLFALGATTSRRGGSLPALADVSWQLLIGGAMLVAVSWSLEAGPAADPSPAVWSAWAYMALGPMAAGYLAWFRAVRALPASVAATGMLLVPVWAAVGSWICLGESLSRLDALAFAVTLGGVALAARPAPGAAAQSTTAGN